MIRLAELHDADKILTIYAAARSFMQRNGNGTQWGANHPSPALVENDIRKKQLYVCCKGDAIYGVFAFVIGSDSTYSAIEDGAWKNNSLYGTIHRIASDGTVKGVFSECLAYCKTQIGNLRIDTHANNLVMQHLIIKHGFERSGIIYTEKGDPRIAYELS